MGLLRVKIWCQSLLSFEQLPNYMIVHFAFAVEVSIVCADAMNSLEVNYLAAPFQCRTPAMSAAFQGASDRDFEEHAKWLGDTIKWYLSPKSAVRFLRRVVEIIESQPEYAQTQDMCTGFCAYSTCSLVCARASDSHRHCRCFQHQMDNLRKRRLNH